MIDNMCKHGRIEGNCIRCKEATIASPCEEVAAFERARGELISNTIKENGKLRARVTELERELAAERAKVEKVMLKVSEVQENCTIYDISPYLDDVFDDIKQILGGEK